MDGLLFYDDGKRITTLHKFLGIINQKGGRKLEVRSGPNCPKKKKKNVHV